MKRSFCKLAVGLLFAMMACSQQTDSPKLVSQSIDRIVYLHSLDMASKSLYAYTLSWTYLVSNEINRQSLRKIVLVDIPQLMQQRKSLTSDAKSGAELDQVLVQIDSLVSMSGESIKHLQTFEDYFDENGEAGENLKQAQANIETKVTPAFFDIEQKMAALLAAEEKTIQSIFESAKDMTEAKEAYAALSEKIEFQRMNLKLYMQTINWVYRPKDMRSKDSLKNNLKMQIRLNEPAFIEEMAHAAVMHGLIAGITDSLVTEANYENPVTMFMSENTLESEISPLFLDIKSSMDKSIKTDVEWFGSLVSGKKDVSKDDLTAFDKLHADLTKAFIEGDVETITAYHHPDVIKAHAYDKLLTGRDANMADLKAALEHYSLNFKEHKIESFEIHGETATEISSFTIEGTPRGDEKPFTFKGRSMVLYIRYKASPAGWALMREMIQQQ